MYSEWSNEDLKDNDLREDSMCGILVKNNIKHWYESTFTQYDQYITIRAIEYERNF